MGCGSAQRDGGNVRLFSQIPRLEELTLDLEYPSGNFLENANWKSKNEVDAREWSNRLWEQTWVWV
jgi:hypothetical protein